MPTDSCDREHVKQKRFPHFRVKPTSEPELMDLGFNRSPHQHKSKFFGHNDDKRI